MKPMKVQLLVGDFAEEQLAALKANDGYCPCTLEKTPDTRCLCKTFREQKVPGKCGCGLFEKVLQ